MLLALLNETTTVTGIWDSRLQAAQQESCQTWLPSLPNRLSILVEGQVLDMHLNCDHICSRCRQVQAADQIFMDTCTQPAAL